MEAPTRGGGGNPVINVHNPIGVQNKLSDNTVPCVKNVTCDASKAF